MPIYEFKCLECGELVELLVLNKDEEIEMKCNKCNSQDLERVLSTTTFITGNNNCEKRETGVCTETKTCGSGTCHTYDVQGPSR
jgi:putative FmdB family regulatory protein